MPVTQRHGPGDFERDTTPKALEVFYGIQRRQTPAQKAQTLFRLIDLVQSLTESGVRQRYPNASEREVFLRAASLRIDRDSMIKAYGWDPVEHE